MTDDDSMTIKRFTPISERTTPEQRAMIWQLSPEDLVKFIEITANTFPDLHEFASEAKSEEVNTLSRGISSRIAELKKYGMNVEVRFDFGHDNKDDSNDDA